MRCEIIENKIPHEKRWKIVIRCLGDSEEELKFVEHAAELRVPCVEVGYRRCTYHYDSWVGVKGWEVRIEVVDEKKRE